MFKKVSLATFAFLFSVSCLGLNQAFAVSEKLIQSAKKEEKVYTGTEIIGIAQMHKSNAVPVRGKKQATEVANMRRG